MTAATLDAVRFMKALGFTRVVLARELSQQKSNTFVKTVQLKLKSSYTVRCAYVILVNAQ